MLGYTTPVSLTAQALNRTVLARQLLLARTRIPIGRALERVAGLQAQYVPSAYVRLWSILDGFAVADLTRALERRRAVQGTLMRSTIHIVSPRDYWHFAAGIGPSRQQWWTRTHRGEHERVDLDAVAARLVAPARSLFSRPRSKASVPPAIKQGIVFFRKN